MLRFIEKETKTEDKSIPVTAQVARESLYSFVNSQSVVLQGPVT